MIIVIIASNNCHFNRRRKYVNDSAQQGPTESMLRRLWLPLYGPCVRGWKLNMNIMNNEYK